MSVEAPFRVNGVQTLAFEPAQVLARLRDPAVDAHEVSPEFVRLFGVAADAEPDEDEDEDEERARLEDLEYASAVAQWRTAWPELLRAVRASDPIGPLPSAALYAFILEGGARVGRPIDVPVDRRALVDWLMMVGLERWLGPSIGVAGLQPVGDFRPYVLPGTELAGRLGAARPTAEVVGWCKAASDPSAASRLELLVDGLAKNLRAVQGQPGAVAVFPNFIRMD